MANSTQQIMYALNACAAAGIPAMLVGAPGTAKSQTIRDWASQMDYDVITLIGSRLDPTDVVGLPKGQKEIYEDRTEAFITVNLLPWWQSKILRERKVVLFLDEFSNTPGAVRASFLSILQDREFPNGMPIPDETIIIGAMNPTGQAADGYELDLPTTNRMFFVEWNPEMDEWIQGMRGGWDDVDIDGNVNEDRITYNSTDITKIDKTEMNKRIMYYRNVIADFIIKNPSFLHKEPTEIADTSIHGINPDDESAMTVLRSAWPSRRSWFNLARALGCLDISGNSSLFSQNTLIQGLVGFEASLQFRDYLNKLRFIDPDKVLKNPTAVKWETITVEEMLILTNTLVEMADANNFSRVIAVFNAIADADRMNEAAPRILALATKFGKVKNTMDKETQQKLMKETTDMFQRYKPATQKLAKKPTGK